MTSCLLRTKLSWNILRVIALSRNMLIQSIASLSSMSSKSSIEQILWTHRARLSAKHYCIFSQTIKIRIGPICNFQGNTTRGIFHQFLMKTLTLSDLTWYEQMFPSFRKFFPCPNLNYATLEWAQLFRCVLSSPTWLLRLPFLGRVTEWLFLIKSFSIIMRAWFIW